MQYRHLIVLKRRMAGGYDNKCMKQVNGLEFAKEYWRRHMQNSNTQFMCIQMQSTIFRCNQLFVIIIISNIY